MQIDPAETPTIVRAGERTFVRQAIDNMGWVDMGECVLVVDALEQRKLEGEVLEAIARTAGDKPVRYVLNTHTHGDHTALNKMFRKRFAAEIVNYKTCDIPDDGKWFETAAAKVQMLHMPGCHTGKDCVVWVPDDSVLFVGDIFGWGLVGPNGGIAPGQAGVILEIYSRLIALDAKTVVPGHGPVCTTGELKRWAAYFRWLIEEVGARAAEGKTGAQVLEEVAPPEDMHGWWRFLAWKHADSVSKVFAAARRGRLVI